LRTPQELGRASPPTSRSARCPHDREKARSSRSSKGGVRCLSAHIGRSRFAGRRYRPRPCGGLEQSRLDQGARGLADDVHVTATTTQPTMPTTDLTGIEDYMRGLIDFAQAVVPGSQRVLASVGDERNALLMLIVEADLAEGRSRCRRLASTFSTRTTRSRRNRSPSSLFPTDLPRRRSGTSRRPLAWIRRCGGLAAAPAAQRAKRGRTPRPTPGSASRERRR
jgi:hypothetical protein